MAPLNGENMAKNEQKREITRMDARNFYYPELRETLMTNNSVTEYGSTKVTKAQGAFIARRISSADTEVPSTLFRRMSSTGNNYPVYNTEQAHSLPSLHQPHHPTGLSASARDPPRENIEERQYKSSYPVTDERRMHNPPVRTKGVPGKHNLGTNNVVWELPDKYKVIDIVGSGSYGQVCRAFDIENQRYVAIKRIHKVFEDLIDCKRILREIAILNRLDHPNVVKVLDIVVPTDLDNFNVLYVVLEIAASDIKLLIRSPAFLNDNHIRLLMYNLLCGVNYLHALGIFHRDLKPANCLVNRDCSVKICDFGLARTVALNRETSTLESHCSLTARELEDEMSQGNLLRLQSSSARLVDYNDELAHFQQRRMNETYTRQLTGHVVTRWYRAPELILLQENYTAAIDVWSIGCIFAELLNMVKANMPDSSARSPLFPGTSCFPLSPHNKNSAEKAKDHDQLNVIFNVIGTPNEEDIAAIAKPEVRRYVKMFHPRKGIDLYKRFKGTPPPAIHLLQQMLTFNPEKRITAADALKHEYFQNFYKPQHVEAPVEKLTVPFNDWINMSESQLRYAFLREIQRYHPEFKIPLKIIYKP
ncbi:Mitogen-activated protein kinase 7 [Babesia sp. Xinjiang]|uniref:Mitogen-activated protein kinase 7 n=1 Tax=Babesia sp. Xinjiang TaxID=462227 RepID=UPI000A24E724|nr:Mitogen-activated protein kinase 7 [Babesia sp. Xinjiang]ORM39663.1 Mitogen-activated protein kinase 7 [Babesia sp. Xinjiang]